MKQQQKDLSSDATPSSTTGNWQNGLKQLEASIKDCLSSLQDIRTPLNDSKEVIPKATSHLDRISAQTEMAATKVLDMVDTIATAQNDIISALNEAINMLNDGKVEGAVISKTLEKAEECANRTLNDTFVIMEALQFQDITTQQIDHAASLLEEVESKIGGIIGSIDPADSSKGATVEVDGARTRKRAFDPHADMEFKHTDQSAIDELVSSSKKDNS